MKTLVLFMGGVLLFGFSIGLFVVTLIPTKNKVVESYSSLAAENLVLKRAKEYHGTLVAYKEQGVWWFINKDGKPCKLFVVVK